MLSSGRVAVYRVVAEDGLTVREYVKGPVGSNDGRIRAVEHAARVNGRVFFVDREGFLTLVFGERTRLSA